MDRNGEGKDDLAVTSELVHSSDPPVLWGGSGDPGKCSAWARHTYGHLEKGGEGRLRVSRWLVSGL